MTTNAAPGSHPVRGRINLILVLLTFVALCAAFFAGAIHQSDSLADSHDGVVAASVEQSVDDETGTVNSNAVAEDVVGLPSGWLTALVAACALFVLWMLTITVGRLLSRPGQSALDAAPVRQRNPLPVFSVRRPALSILLETSISRT